MSLKCLTRRERLALARAALSGMVSGATRAIVNWLIDLSRPFL